MTGTPGLSVVVPVLNEEENVPALVEAVRTALGTGDDWELLLVDDGSTDGTAECVRAWTRRDPRVRLIRLARRYGQSTAMQAGFDHALGPVVVTLDGDLQNDPADIPLLLAKLEEGYDLVTGYRERRQDLFLTRRLPSIIANRMIAVITGVRVRDNGCSLKAYRRELLQRVRLYSDLHRFIPAVATGTAGARIAEIPVRHHPRTHGVSKYGLSRVGAVLVDLLAVKTIRSVRAQPLALFGVATAFAGAAGTAALGLALHASRSWGEAYTGSMVLPGVGFTLLALAAFLAMGGIVAQVLVTVYHPVLQRRGPVIREVGPLTAALHAERS